MSFKKVDQKIEGLKNKVQTLKNEINVIQKQIQKQEGKSSTVTIVCYKVAEGEPKKNYQIKKSAKNNVSFLKFHNFTLSNIKGQIPFKPNVFYNKVDNPRLIIKYREFIVKYFRDIGDNLIADYVSSYVDGFICLGIQKLKTNNPIGYQNFRQRKLRLDSCQKAINSKYTSYKINDKALSFTDLIIVDHCEYVKNNFHSNSCMVTAIIDQFHNKFEGMAKGARKYKDGLSYKYLCEILKLEYKPSDIECSIEEAETFFKRYGYGLTVFDVYMNIITEIEPKSKQGCLKLILKDDHVYRLNDNLQTLSHLKFQKLEESTINIHVSPFYSTKELKPYDKAYLVESVDDLMNDVKNHKDMTEDVHLKFISNNVEHLCCDLIDRGCEQKIYYDGSIYKMTFKIDNVYISLEKFSIENNEMEPEIELDTIEEYTEYNKELQNLRNNVLCDTYLSYHHPSVLEIQNAYPIHASVGYSGEWTEDDFYAVDENKAYAQCFSDMTHVPVFQYFDVYRKYDNSKIEPYVEYVIEILENTEALSYIFNQKITRVYGFLLLKLKFSYRVIYFRKPYKLVETGSKFKDLIEDVYSNTKLHKNIQKKIVNVVTGLLERKVNKKHETQIFRKLEDAEFYANKYEGNIIPIFSKEFVKTIDIDGQECESCDIKFYAVNVSKSRELVNGFSPMKDIIYNLQKIKTYRAYMKLTEHNIKVYGIKTDCLLIKSKKNIKNIFEINSKMGGYKIERNKSQPSTELKIEENELIPIPDFDSPTIQQFNNEYDTKAINEYLSAHRTAFIKGKYPGTGKSHSIKSFDKNTLFVMPYRELCQELKSAGFEAITFNSLFGLDINDVKKNARYDVSQFTTICFDECFLHEPRRLVMVDSFIRENTNINVYACGDLNQCESINFSDSEYISKCIDIIFPYQIYFQDIKRCKDKKDADKIKEMYDDLFHKKLHIDDIIKKHNLKTIKKYQEIKTVNNVCYFNATCSKVNNFVHYSLLNHNKEYVEGEYIKCKKHTKLNKAQTLNTNYKYKIMKITKDDIHLLNEVDKETFVVKKGIVNSSFKLPYCSTIESIQGKTIQDNITIFDVDSSYMSRNKIWTCLTRVVSPSQITIFVNSDKARNNLFNAKLKQYFEHKIIQYKVQDSVKDRKIVDTEYIDVKWFDEELTKSNQCYMCHKTFELDINNSVVVSDITADRLDNSISHTKANCKLCCLNCNRTSK